MDKNYFSSTLFKVDIPVKICKEPPILILKNEIIGNQEEDKVEVKKVKEIEEDEIKVEEKGKNNKEEIFYKNIDANRELNGKIANDPDKISVDEDINDLSLFDEHVDIQQNKGNFIEDVKTLFTQKVFIL